jgi:hypothetical protein
MVNKKKTLVFTVIRMRVAHPLSSGVYEYINLFACSQTDFGNGRVEVAGSLRFWK